MATININYFEIDNIAFDGLIGYELLKTTNQITYPVQPNRQIDGSMKNINDYETFVVPKVEIGFKLIKNDQYQILRDILTAKRTFSVTYYDNDFGQRVTHQMYAEPDDLKNFTSLGQEILGVKDFKISFIGTLNEEDICTATFGGSIERTAKWGRTITVPSGKWQRDGKGLIFSGGDKMTLFADVSLIKYEIE